MYDSRIGTIIGAGTLQTSIMSYLAAHFASLTDVGGGVFKAQSQDAIEEKLGDATVKYESSTTSDGEGLGSTSYGQMAMALDTTGRLRLVTTAKRIQTMGLTT